MTTHDAIKHLSYKISYYKGIDERWADAVNIDALEIAVRAMAKEQKTGKWIAKSTFMPDHYGGYYIEQYVCTNCKSEFFNPSKFCPWCGADMREEEDNAEIH